MSVKGLDNILKQREQQYGQILGDKVHGEGVSDEDIEYIKKAIVTLAENQSKLYQKLEEISEKLDK